MPQDASDIEKDIKELEKLIKTTRNEEQKQHAKKSLQKYCSVFYARNIRLAAAKILLENSSISDFATLRLALSLGDHSAFNYIGKHSTIDWLLEDHNKSIAGSMSHMSVSTVRPSMPAYGAARSSSSVPYHPKQDQPSAQLRYFWAEEYLFMDLPHRGVNASKPISDKVRVAQSLLQMSALRDELSIKYECQLTVYEFCLTHKDSTDAFIVNNLHSLPEKISAHGPAYSYYIEGLQQEKGLHQGYNDFRQAFLKFKEACAQDNATANMWFKLAGYYIAGLGVPKDPAKARECLLDNARKLLLNNPRLAKAEANHIYLVNLQRLFYSFRSPVVLELLKAFYKEMILERPVIQGLGIVNEFAQVMRAGTQHVDDASLLTQIDNARQELVNVQRKHQQQNEAQYEEQLVEHHSQILMSKHHSTTEQISSREELKKLSNKGSVLATAKLASYYTALPGGTDRAIFYVSLLGDRPELINVDERFKQNRVVLWFHEFNRLGSLMRQDTLPAKERITQIMNIVNNLKDTANMSGDEMLGRELILQLYLFYRLFKLTLDKASGVDTVLKDFVKAECERFKSQVEACNPHVVAALDHVYQRNLPQALQAFDAATKLATVSPFVWRQLVQLYGDSERATYRDEKGDAASTFNPEKERACFETLQALIDSHATPFALDVTKFAQQSQIDFNVIDVIKQSLEVYLRSAVYLFNSVNALLMLKQRYLKKIQQCKDSEQIEQYLADFQDDIHKKSNSADFEAKKAQQIEALKREAHQILGKLYYVQADKCKNEKQFELALQFYIKAAMQCDYAPAKIALPSAYLHAAAAIMKPNPNRGRHYLDNAVQLKPSLFGEAHLIEMRAVINGYSDMPWTVNYSHAFKLCEMVIEDYNNILDLSVKMEVLKFIYQYAFYEHEIAGYADWLRQKAADEKSPVQLRIYICLNLMAYLKHHKLSAECKKIEEQLMELAENEKEVTVPQLIALANATREPTNAAAESATVVRKHPQDEKGLAELQLLSLRMLLTQDDNTELLITTNRTIDKSVVAWQTPMAAETSHTITPAVQELINKLNTRNVAEKPVSKEITRVIHQLQDYCQPQHRIADRIAAAAALSVYYQDQPIYAVYYHKLMFKLGNTAHAHHIISSYVIPTVPSLQHRQGQLIAESSERAKYRKIANFWAATQLLAEMPHGAETLRDKINTIEKLIRARFDYGNVPEINLVIYEFYLKNHEAMLETADFEVLEGDLIPHFKIPAPYDIYRQGLQHEYGYPTGTSDVALAFQYFRAATRQAPEHVTAWMWFKLAEYYATGKGCDQPNLAQARLCFEQALAKMQAIQDFPKADMDAIYVSKLKELFYHYHNPIALQLLQEFYQQRVHQVSVEQSAGIVNEFANVVSVVEANIQDPVFLQTVQVAKQSIQEYQQKHVDLYQADLVNSSIEKNYQILMDGIYDGNAKIQALLELMQYCRNNNKLATTRLMNYYCQIGNYTKAAHCYIKFSPEIRAEMFENYKRSFQNNDRALFLWCQQQILALIENPLDLLMSNDNLNQPRGMLSYLMTYTDDPFLADEIQLFLLQFYTLADVRLSQFQTPEENVKKELQVAIGHYRSRRGELLMKQQGNNAIMHSYLGMSYALQNNKPNADDELTLAQSELAKDELMPNSKVTLWFTLASCYTGKMGIAADPDQELLCLQKARTLADQVKGSCYAEQLLYHIRYYQSEAALDFCFQEYSKKMQGDPANNALIVAEFMADLDFPTSAAFEVRKQSFVQSLLDVGKMLERTAAYALALDYTNKGQHELALDQYLIAAQKGDEDAKDFLAQAYLNAGECLVSSCPILAMQHFRSAIQCDRELAGRVDLALARAAINGHHPLHRDIANFQLAFDLCQKVMTSQESTRNDHMQVLNFIFDNALFEVDAANCLALLQACPQPGNEQDLRSRAGTLLQYLQSGKTQIPEQDAMLQRNIDQTSELRNALMKIADAAAVTAGVTPPAASSTSSFRYLNTMGVGGACKDHPAPEGEEKKQTVTVASAARSELRNEQQAALTTVILKRKLA